MQRLGPAPAYLAEEEHNSYPVRNRKVCTAVRPQWASVTQYLLLRIWLVTLVGYVAIKA